MSPISSSQYKILFSILTSDKYPSDSLDRSSDPIVRCADIQPPILPGQVGQLYLLPSNVSSWKLRVKTTSIKSMKGETEVLCLKDCHCHILPVSYFLQVTLGIGFPVASHMMLTSSPAVTSSVRSQAWIFGGTAIKYFTKYWWKK